jgi:threonine dehydrogenase-like Zn-dependent dehydrogenase
MKANCWVKRNEVEVRHVPDPRILNSRDAIVRITSTAICGSDLHLLDGYVPTMQEGDVMGHEFMGEVVEVGPGVDGSRLRVGDRVVGPFPIACGACAACRAELYSCCENTNLNAGIAEKTFGHPVAGIFGYSHLTGGFAGGQAQYAACRSPTSARCGSGPTSATSRSTSTPTSSPPGTWAPRCATSSPGTSWPTSAPRCST